MARRTHLFQVFLSGEQPRGAALGGYGCLKLSGAREMLEEGVDAESIAMRVFDPKDSSRVSFGKISIAAE